MWYISKEWTDLSENQVYTVTITQQLMFLGGKKSQWISQFASLCQHYTSNCMNMEKKCNLGVPMLYVTLTSTKLN